MRLFTCAAAVSAVRVNKRRVPLSPSVGVGVPSDGLDAAGDRGVLWRHQFRGGECGAA